MVRAPVDDDRRLDVLMLSADSGLAEMYRLKLELDGYRVVTVRRLQEWVPRTGFRPDILLVDVGNGNASAAADLERLRAHPTLKGLPRLVLSTRTSAELLQLGLRLRPTEYVIRIAMPDLTHAPVLMSF
jgi:DNA-binding response OmpR family regulator